MYYKNNKNRLLNYCIFKKNSLYLNCNTEGRGF